MKILYIVENLTSKVDGYSLRTYNLCKNLKNRNNQIYMVNFEIKTGVDCGYNFLEYYIPMKFPSFFNKISGRLYKLLISFFDPFSQFTPHEIKRIHEDLEKIIKENNIDLIHVQGPLSGILLMNYYGSPKLIDLTDSLSLYFKRKTKSNTNYKDKFLNYFIYKWSIGIERRLLENYSCSTVVSEKDLENLKKLHKVSNIFCIPNGIDSSYFSPRTSSEIYHSIFFHGTMSFEPNIRSILYITREILPIIKLKIPDIKFFIIGRDPPQVIQNLNIRQDIVVTGEVKDLRDHIAMCNVALMPMFSGGGVKNKIMEAMAMGKSVVTNSLGAESFDEIIKKSLVIKDSAEEIAYEVIKLLTDDNLRNKTGRNNINVIKNYNWVNSTEEYEKLYLMVTEHDFKKGN